MKYKDLSRIDAILTDLLTMKADRKLSAYGWVTENYNLLREVRVAVDKALDEGVELVTQGIAESLELVSNA